jgi:hypothetical protein
VVGLPLGGVIFLVRVAGDDDRILAVRAAAVAGLQAGEAEVGQGARSGALQVGGQVVVAGGGDLAGGAAAGR